MKLFQLASSFYLLAASFFLLSSPLSAKEGCDQLPPTDYQGPQYYVADPNNRCGLPSQQREIEELKTASVVCLDNPTLIADTINFEEKDSDFYSILSLFGKDFLTGQSSINFVSYDSFGIKRESLTEINPELTAKITKAVSLPDYFDASLYDALCVYEGKTSRDECNQFLNNQLSSEKENLLASGGWWQFANSRKAQFEAKKARAAEIIACKNGTEDPLTPCDQPYMVNKTTNMTSLDLAEKIIDMDYQAFKDESPDMQMTILSLRESRAYSAVYLAVREKRTGQTYITSITGLTSTRGRPNPRQHPTSHLVVETSYIPGIYKTTQRAEELYRLVNKKQTGDQGLTSINQRLSTEFGDTTDIEALVAKKIADSNLDCSAKSFSYQAAGSQEDYPEADSPLISLNLNVQPADNIPSWITALETEREIEELYEAYLIAPTQKLAETMAQDDNSPLPMMFKKELQKSAQKDVYLPHQLSNQPPKVSKTVQTNDQVPVPCPTGVSGPCYRTETNTYGLEFNSQGKNLEGPLPGAESTQWMLYLGGKSSWRKGSPEHFSSTCYANELASKVNSSLLASAATSLFDLLGRNTNNNLSNCPPDFTVTQSSSSSSGDICQVASDYNLDCNLLKAIWEIETGSSTRLPTGTYGNLSCCNSLGFCGPMQVGGGIVGTISPEQPRDVCIEPDAFELASRWLLIKKWCSYNSAECISSPNPYEWKNSYPGSQGIAELSSSPAERRTQVEGFIYGWYGTTLPDPASESRWGTGRSYVDAVLYYLENCTDTEPGQCLFFQ